MTGFGSTRMRAVYLLCSTRKRRLAYRALLDLLMPFPLVHLADRAFAAFFGSASSLCSTLNTMLRVLRRTADFSAMYLLVTRNANGQSIAYVKSGSSGFGEGFNMMSMEIASFTAHLASIIIPGVDRFPPLGQFTACLAARSVKAFPAFPNWRCFAGFPLNKAFVGANLLAWIYGIKVLAADDALLDVWLSAIAPALLGTIVRSAGTISFYFELFSAFLAGVGNLSIFHVSNYTISGTRMQLSPGYVAVAIQRFFDHTGIDPVLMD